MERNQKLSVNNHRERTDVKEHGKDRYVIPHDDEWAIKVEGSEKSEKIFHTKKEAVQQARMEAKKVNGALTIQKRRERWNNGFHTIPIVVFQKRIDTNF
jgi:hypothetical protein